ncbi:MAG TPA: OmpH family outer membrane protein [Candidatus Methylomirabilis sp.]|nr:OmpH family outer membrane protein [Candidatus Methylomirabilis sp.]
MRRTWHVAAVALLSLGLGMWFGAPAPLAQTANGSRVGFVDIQRVLARSAAGMAAREQLEKEKAVMQKQVDSQRAELEQLRDEIEKKGQLLSADARREKQEQLERKVRDARRLVDDLQATLQKKEEAMLSKVLQDLGGLIQKVSKDKGYTIVLERQRSSVLYASADADLTEDIIRAYDDETKKGKK